MQQDERNRAPSPDGAAADIGGGTAKFVILGQTEAGRTFRPSDWAERLAGVMAAFSPRRAGSQQHLTYSPYVVPSSIRGIKCVIVDPKLRDLEPMAYTFMLAFARDNHLTTEVLAEAGKENAAGKPS